MRVSKYLDHLNGLLFKGVLRGWLRSPSLGPGKSISVLKEDEASNQPSWARFCCGNQQFLSNTGLQQHKYFSCSQCVSIMGWKGPRLAVTISHTAKSPHQPQRNPEGLKPAIECSGLDVAYTVLLFTVCWPVTWPQPTSKGLGHGKPANSWKVRPGDLMDNIHDYHRVIDSVENVLLPYR